MKKKVCQKRTSLLLGFVLCASVLFHPLDGTAASPKEALQIEETGSSATLRDPKSDEVAESAMISKESQTEKVTGTSMPTESVQTTQGTEMVPESEGPPIEKGSETILETEAIQAESGSETVAETQGVRETEPSAQTDETETMEVDSSLEQIESKKNTLPQISYTTHVQSFGWQNWAFGGEESGTTNLSKRLESIKIRLAPSSLPGGVEYRTHVQTFGWTGWVSDGRESGTTGLSKRLEAIQIRLTGELNNLYDIYYRVHCQSFGWTGWAKNGEPAGSMGYAKRLEAIQIQLVEKGQAAPGDVTGTYHEKLMVIYQTHVQTFGWQDETSNGQKSGTTGLAKRLEGIRIRLENHLLTQGSVEYCTHVQTFGWQDWTPEGGVAGTTGKAKRLEAIKIRLTGAMADTYDIYYRVHCQTFGWTGWAKNGEPAGSEGFSKRLEAIEILLTQKGAKAPGPTENTCFKKESMGNNWRISQYRSTTSGQSMCYTIEDDYGNLAIIDGGYEKDADMVRELIRQHGNRVSAWIITHPHPDHVGAFNAIMSNPQGISVDRIYAVPVHGDRYRETAESYDQFEMYETFLRLTAHRDNLRYVSENDEFDLLGLTFRVLHAWDDTTNKLTSNLCNNGSMVFVLKGSKEKMLFLSDMESESESYILERHQEELDADYVQAGHHGNWGPTLKFYSALSPKGVFMDAPNWLLEESNRYDGYLLKNFFEEKGIRIYRFSTAPNKIVIH
ncbi:MAG: MBL fold metallo-hydrolase [Lachnospiraceae bacterium]|nr:MBL fold metallo-hydrolase [Lachnospiraceae bacterium]